MKAIILTLCLFISFELVAQECEFETTTYGGIYTYTAYSNKPKVISSDSCFYIINVGSATNYNEQHLRVTKYDKCNVLLKKIDYKIRKDLEGCDIIITKEPSNKWNICLINDKSLYAITMFEMDADCNMKEIFQTTNQSVSINHFIRSYANQYIFVGHKNSKATVFAIDTLGNKTWQIVDSTKGLPYSFYNQIQKGTDNKIYLLGAANNKFTKSVIDMNGTITNTLYIETGTTQILDSLNYGLTLSQNGQYIYAFIAINNYQLLNKYDDLGRELNTNLTVMGKITEVFKLKATSNGFATFTNSENYLIDANLQPYFNQIAVFGKNSPGNSGSSYTNYQSDLLLENDSFIVSLGSWVGGARLGPFTTSMLTFYKAKIASNLYKPKIVASDSVTLGNSFLYLKVQEVSPVYVSWSYDNINVIRLYSNLIFKNNITTFDTTNAYLEIIWFFASDNSTTTTICARNYFKAQWSVDVCQLFTFYKYPVSITNTNAAESIKIYPNPTKEFIEVNCGHLNNVTFKLYNLFGQEMEWTDETVLNNISRRLRLSQIPKGIYILKINSNEGEFSQKILVEE